MTSNISSGWAQGFEYLQRFLESLFRRMVAHAPSNHPVLTLCDLSLGPHGYAAVGTTYFCISFGGCQIGAGHRWGDRSNCRFLLMVWDASILASLGTLLEMDSSSVANHYDPRLLDRSRLVLPCCLSSCCIRSDAWQAIHKDKNRVRQSTEATPGVVFKPHTFRTST